MSFVHVAVVLGVTFGFAARASTAAADDKVSEGASASSAAAVAGNGNASGADLPVAARPAALEALARVGTKLGNKPAPRPIGSATQLLRTGFRARQQTGEVLLHTSAAADLQPLLSASRDRAVFVLKHCRAFRSTDRLPLDTRFFKSPVTRVSLKQRGADLEIVVALRGPVVPATRQEAGPGGSSVWVLEFAQPPRATQEGTRGAWQAPPRTTLGMLR